mmetsp:Transcript_18078/g.45306  ORF Transcript_18078/g.45306 Transcript_18078/m.45306 type:complete len:691 (-) Transcript_18078:1227-3299(-)
MVRGENRVRVEERLHQVELLLGLHPPEVAVLDFLALDNVVPHFLHDDVVVVLAHPAAFDDVGVRVPLAQQIAAEDDLLRRDRKPPHALFPLPHENQVDAVEVAVLEFEHRTAPLRRDVEEGEKRFFFQPRAQLEPVADPTGGLLLEESVCFVELLLRGYLGFHPPETHVRSAVGRELGIAGRVDDIAVPLGVLSALFGLARVERLAVLFEELFQFHEPLRLVSAFAAGCCDLLLQESVQGGLDLLVRFIHSVEDRRHRLQDALDRESCQLLLVDGDGERVVPGVILDREHSHDELGPVAGCRVHFVLVCAPFFPLGFCFFLEDGSRVVRRLDLAVDPFEVAFVAAAEAALSEHGVRKRGRIRQGQQLVEVEVFIPVGQRFPEAECRIMRFKKKRVADWTQQLEEVGVRVLRLRPLHDRLSNEIFVHIPALLPEFLVELRRIQRKPAQRVRIQELFVNREVRRILEQILVVGRNAVHMFEEQEEFVLGGCQVNLDLAQRLGGCFQRVEEMRGVTALHGLLPLEPLLVFVVFLEIEHLEIVVGLGLQIRHALVLLCVLSLRGGDGGEHVHVTVAVLLQHHRHLRGPKPARRRAMLQAPKASLQRFGDAGLLRFTFQLLSERAPRSGRGVRLGFLDQVFERGFQYPLVPTRRHRAAEVPPESCGGLAEFRRHVFTIIRESVAVWQEGGPRQFL